MIRCGVLQLYPFIWAPSMGLSSGAICLRLGDYHHDFQPSTGMGFTSIHSLSCQLANSTFFEYQGSHGVAAALLVCTIIYTHRYPFFSLICIFVTLNFSLNVKSVQYIPLGCSMMVIIGTRFRTYFKVIALQ